MGGPRSSTGLSHIPELDGVRGIACLSVLFAHCLVGILTTPPQTLTTFLLSGVDLFFVLSGFLIGGILLDNREAPNFFQAFWIRRIARIFPVLYALLATYALALFIRSRFDLPQMDLWLLASPIPPFWSYATFTQSIPIALSGYGGPRWVGITWSLAIEEQFYFLFPVLVYFVSRRSIVLTTLASIFVAPLLRAMVEARYGWYAAYVMLPCRMDALMFGVLAAIVIRNEGALQLARRLRLALDGIIVLIVLAIVYASYPITSFSLKYSAIALMFALLILRIFLYKPGLYHWALRTKALTAAGLISYALYMYHQAVNGPCMASFSGRSPKSARSPTSAFL